MGTITNRRALLGTIGLAPIALAAISAPSAPATAGRGADPRWPALIADFRAKYAAWLATIDPQEDAIDAFNEACLSLPPEPKAPGSATKGNILDKTLRELRDAGDTPEHKAAYAAYEQQHTAWKAQRAALREKLVGPADAAYDEAFAIRSAAFQAMTAHPVTNLADLGEKIAVISDDYEGCEIPHEHFADVLADVRRFAAEGR